MSLLLDALKRAEEAKRAKLSVESASDSTTNARIARTVTESESVPSQGNDKSAAANAVPADLSLEIYKDVIPAKTVTRGPPGARPASADAQHGVELSLESIADDLPASPADEARPHAEPAKATSALLSKLDATRIDAAQSRDTARNVFVAKQATSLDEGVRKKWLLPAILAGIVVVVSSGGWYVWNEINRMSRPVPASVAARPSPAVTLPPALINPPVAPQKVEITPKAVAPVEPPLPPLLPPTAEQAPLPKPAVRTPAFEGAPLTDREALARTLKEAPAARDGPVELKLARSIEPPTVNAELTDAYSALRQADYPRARAQYAKLVQLDPLNPDAQLGLATVLARMGDTTLAARHYRQALVIDPRNGAALAGLLAVSSSRSPALESELKLLVNRNPEAASLRFTLGNLYASERRWVEAQQAYFEAYRLESANADYMYNLAVSLDQLKQSKLARDYYQKALAARPTGGQFDPAAVTRRIKELTPDSGNK